LFLGSFFLFDGLLLLVLRAVSPLVLSRLLTSSVTIKVTTYLLSRELEVDFPSSYVDDHASGVEEGSS
jgi:hypothetical protein